MSLNMEGSVDPFGGLPEVSFLELVCDCKRPKGASDSNEKKETSRRRGGNVEIAKAISKGRWERWKTAVWFSTVSSAPSFPPCSGGVCPSVSLVRQGFPAASQQGQLDVLHPPGCLGVAESFRLSFQQGRSDSRL